MDTYSKPCDIIIREKKDFKRNIQNLNALDMTIFQEGIIIWGDDILQKQWGLFEGIKEKYNLVPKPFLGKGGVGNWTCRLRERF